MEIEAKFRVSNRAAHRELLRLRSIAGYTLVRVGRVEVVDRYFDTADGRLLAADYACRLRTQDGQVIATLKGLGSAEDGLHRRDEREVVLPSLLLEPAAWPPSDARALALELTAGAPLQPLFDLNQSRVKANVMDGTRRVGEWSLDEVRAVVGKRPAFYYELEIELGPEGLESDLERLAQALRDEQKLAPEPSSKFARGLEMLRLRGTAVESGVSDEERAQLAVYEATLGSEIARRAGAVLAWASGLPTREIVARTGLSAGRVRFWLREFRVKRMSIFAQPLNDDEATGTNNETLSEAAHASGPGARPGRSSGKTRRVQPGAESPKRPSAGEAGPAPTARAAQDTPGAGADGARPVRPATKKTRSAAREGLPSITDFAHVHGVHSARARYVAENAGVLFDALRKVHGLPRKRRKLLRAAALLATVGAGQGAGDPARAGRDLILAQPLHGVSTEDRLELACVVGLQREKLKPAKEVALEALEPKRRKEAIVLACLLQMADALTYGEGRSTRIVAPDCKDSEPCEITLEGPLAAADARRADARAKHWRQALRHELSFVAVKSPPTVAADPAIEPTVAAASSSSVAQEPGPLPELPPAEALDAMAEAGRKVMFTHFIKMLANEAGTRDGADIEFLHDMRVSTRRLRAAYRIFEPFYERKAVARFNKELRRAGAALGAVRDLDVLIERAEAYEAALPPEEGLSLAPLLTEWSARREVARRELLAYLDGHGYRKFVEDFRTFLLTPGQGVVALPEGQPVAHQVRHVIPRLILERYEQVRAYEAVLPAAPVTTYHALRIDCKRLRYALEFFKALLGPEAANLIKQVVALQELLGALQDAHVAEGLIVAFITEQRGRVERSRKQAESLPGVEAYLLTQQQIQADLLGLFDAPWATVTGSEFRRSLGLALATP